MLERIEVITSQDMENKPAIDRHSPSLRERVGHWLEHKKKNELARGTHKLEKVRADQNIERKKVSERHLLPRGCKGWEGLGHRKQARGTHMLKRVNIKTS